MQKYALVVGVELYMEAKRIPQVTYAQRDAEEMSAVLKALGYEVVVLLLNDGATKGRVLSMAKELADVGAKGDQLLFFFAGHGLPYDGRNYLLCHDTFPNHVEETAVSIRELFDRFSQSKARQRMMFLDCCHSGLTESEGARSFIDTLDENELREQLNDGEHCVTFSSCGKDEKSWPSNEFKHGHWTYQLLRALRGDVPTVLKGGLLLSGNLQDFLRTTVKKEVAIQSHGRVQTPKKWGEEDGTFIVADISPILATKERERETAFGEVKRAVFEFINSGDIKKLAGFKKHHTVPTEISFYTKNFVQGIAAPAIDEEVEEAFRAVSSSKKYADLDIRDRVSGITTPDFKYSVRYEQDEDDPSRYVFTRHLEDISDPCLLEEPWFREYFGNKFDAIELSFFKSQPIAKVIAQAEKIPGFDVSTDRYRSYCSIEHPDFDGHIYILPDSVTFQFNGFRPLEQLISGFNIGLKLLGRHEDIVRALKDPNPEE